MAGVPIRVVQEILGHGTGAMTQRYSHVAPDSLKAEMERAFEGPEVAEPFRHYSAVSVHDGAETCSEVQYVKAA